MQKYIKHFSGVFIVTLSLSACVNKHGSLTKQYGYQDRNLQKQCLDQLQTNQQFSVPLYYDNNGDPVYKNPPAIETFHCSTVPPASPSINELNERIP